MLRGAFANGCTGSGFTLVCTVLGNYVYRLQSSHPGHRRVPTPWLVRALSRRLTDDDAESTAGSSRSTRVRQCGVRRRLACWPGDAAPTQILELIRLSSRSLSESPV